MQIFFRAAFFILTTLTTLSGCVGDDDPASDPQCADSADCNKGDASGEVGTDASLLDAIAFDGQAADAIISDASSSDAQPADAKLPEKCTTINGSAKQTGFKRWCWHGITLPNGFGNFANGDLSVNAQCDPKGLAIVGDQMTFFLDPVNPPPPPSGCDESFNMRAEFALRPWPVKNPVDTEEWFGWRYTFAKDYKIDPLGGLVVFQVHDGVKGRSPQVSINLISANEHQSQKPPGKTGEIYVSNHTLAGSERHTHTFLIPKAGDAFDIVVHTVWGGPATGRLQVWINGKSVRNEQKRTVYAGSEWGGNAKWGLYKHPWRDSVNVNASKAAGITHIAASMGTLRQITRAKGDPDYGKSAYDTVKPR